MMSAYNSSSLIVTIAVLLLVMMMAMSTIGGRAATTTGDMEKLQRFLEIPHGLFAFYDFAATEHSTGIAMLNTV